VNKRKTVLFKRSFTSIDLLRKSKKKGIIRCKKSRIDIALSSNAFLKKIRKTGINIRAIKGDVSKGDFKSIKFKLASEF
jgi:RNase P/RNase MRP subunit POP5